MVHSVQTKNHQGGISEKNSHESLTRLYSTGEIGDSYWCLLKYVQKLNPLQTAFFQRPSPKAKEADMIWYENSPLGVNTLATMMKEISLGAGLSQTYTNHSVRATAITLWSNANVPSRHIMSISGHANEQSISSYNSRPSVKQLKNCSNILSNALVSNKEVSSAAIHVPASSSISYGFRQNTDPRSTDPLLTPLLTPLLIPYKINGKMKIKKAQNYQWDPIQVHQ